MDIPQFVHPIEPFAWPRKIRVCDEPHLKRRYDEGASIAELAEAYAVTPPTIRSALLRCGVKMRPAGRHKGVTKKRKPIQLFELYRWWDNETLRLLYIGISYSAVARAQSHSYTSEWYSDHPNKTMIVQAFGSREELLAAERKAIAEERPMYNKLGL